ncbi:MAG TPA: hypothetical protein VK472_01965 [Allosphingosinicella sp.]|nr:hypothetical protein [Allosphingosinicella sp.]
MHDWTAAMSAAEIFSAVGGALLASIVTAFATLRGKHVDTLHLSEIEFRKALLLRVEQLEKMAREDSKRIRELEAEVRMLRIENERLRLAA